jgi:hypothetical protein
MGGALAAVGLGIIIWQAASVAVTKTTDMAAILDRQDPVIAGLLDRIEDEKVRAFYLNGQTLPGLIDSRTDYIDILADQNLALARDDGSIPARTAFIQTQI